MRKLIVQTFLSVDGVMQAPGGPEEDPSGGFELGGWSVNYWDEDMGRHMDKALGVPFDLVLGRRTYEIFAAHWPHVTDDPAGNALNKATKYVASKTLTPLDWEKSHLLEGDAGEAVRRLKNEDGPELQVHGSGNFAQTLIAEDLVDEFRLWLFPLILGGGKRLFPTGGVPAGLELVEQKTSSTGVVMATYRRAGDIKPGSFQLEQPTEAELKRRSSLSEEGG